MSNSFEFGLIGEDPLEHVENLVKFVYLPLVTASGQRDSAPVSRKGRKCDGIFPCVFSIPYFPCLFMT